jgi:hypothetical protein
MSILVNNLNIFLIGDMGDVEGLASILGCRGETRCMGGGTNVSPKVLKFFLKYVNL